jgi:hypothetical protein
LEPKPLTAPTLDLETIAIDLGGVVEGDEVVAPGPLYARDGEEPSRAVIRVRPAPELMWGVAVTCREHDGDAGFRLLAIDYVRKRLDLPVPLAANDNKPAANDNIGISLLSFADYKEQDGGSSADAVIRGLVRSGTLIAIGGRPGSGKTALMLAMAEALDAGKPFLERETQPTTVAYIAAEDGGDIANRLEAMGNENIKIVQSPEGLPLTKPARAKDVAREIIRQAKAIDPERNVMLVVDTLRAALGGVSVLEDKTTSPALNALREVAEAEGAVIAVLNHTNRENNKATKGETLEAVAALELVLLEGDGGWFTIYVGKNRSGPGHRNIGKVRYTSAPVGDVTAAIVDEIVADDTVADNEPKERGPSPNARILEGIIRSALLLSTEYRMPFGTVGPRVKVAFIEALRAEFYARKEGSQDTKKKAFNRALSHWIDNGLVMRGEDRDIAFVWFARNETGQRDGTVPNQASVPSVPIDERDGTGGDIGICPVCPGDEATA